MKKNKTPFRRPGAFGKEPRLILTSAPAPQSPTSLACPGWSPKQGRLWAGETCYWLVSQTHQVLTGHRSVISISCYLQGLPCKAWESIALLPSLILVGDRFLIGDKNNNFETCHLDENVNVSSIDLCFVSWWIHGDRDERGKSLRNATSPLNVMKLKKFEPLHSVLVRMQ